MPAEPRVETPVEKEPEKVAVSEPELDLEGIEEAVIDLSPDPDQEVDIGAATEETTVLMGADYYETSDQKADNRKQGVPDVGIGKKCSIEGAIIDKNARIGNGVTIRPHSPDEETVDAGDYVIRDGIVVVPKNSIIPDGMTI